MAPATKTFQFCPYCGSQLVDQSVNHRTRSHCETCNVIHYRNPTVGVAMIVMRESRLLLVERTGTDTGSWCIPCGHVEWGEDIRDAARREAMEETGLDVMPGPVFAVHSNFHNPDQLTVGVWFWSFENSGRLNPGSDALQARFYSINALPEKMAFPTDTLVCEKIRSLIDTGRLQQWIESNRNL